MNIEKRNFLKAILTGGAMIALLFLGIDIKKNTLESSEVEVRVEGDSLVIDRK